MTERFARVRNRLSTPSERCPHSKAGGEPPLSMADEGVEQLKPELTLSGSNDGDSLKLP